MASNNEVHYLAGIQDIKKTETEYSIKYNSGETAKIYILNDHVFRFYMSPTGEFLEYPVPMNPDDFAKINSKRVSDYDTTPFSTSILKQNDYQAMVETKEIKIIFDKLEGTFGVKDKRTNKNALEEDQSLCYSVYNTVQKLKQSDDEFYFGGGMQNGRFTHKGQIVRIFNSNNWVDGGVTSPCPFFWSSFGYGVLRNTWRPGKYDFGSKNHSTVETVHSENYFDAFYFINARPEDILSDYYELTGKPTLMPEYAFYEAHLNTFNRDYWVMVKCSENGAIKFEDGKCYKKYKPDEMKNKKGILESLNGEKDNYQFSARAMIDRYKNHDMPLGWFIPNDGYGSGYGQTDSFEGDLDNLQKFVEYAHSSGVEVALWTESRLEPADPDYPKKGERDLYREVGVGCVALKCDVAWVGKGYSFGLTAVENATRLFTKQAQTRVRPFILMVDGWAGTQRYSSIWSGDQSGGQWEYIRFHIPTYIGSGLSGIPVVGSDMDGIYGGGVKEIQIRDFQWKTFTPLQLNMDGWGTSQKTPFYFDAEAKTIIRAYLKLKSMLLPYNYTIAYESTKGLPMVRAMFLEFPNEKSAYTKDSQYQYMWGPSILVAPVYEKALNIKNDPIRKKIYLPDPEQVWIDLFTGKKYQGGKIYYSIESPLWKIPIFVKDGAIIPLVNCNNNPSEIHRNVRIFQLYPRGKAVFKVYEDDGISLGYETGQSSRTKVSVTGPISNENDDLIIHINRTTGKYRNMVKERSTVLKIMSSAHPQIKVAINGESVEITKVEDLDKFNKYDNVSYFDPKFIINPYFEDITDKNFQKFLLIKIGPVDITEFDIVVKINGFSTETDVIGKVNINENLNAPSKLTEVKDMIKPTSITLVWDKIENAQYYEVETDGVIFTNIFEATAKLEDLKFETEYKFKVRAVNEDGFSKWSDTVTVKTKEDPLKYAVRGVIVNCSIPSQPGSHVSNLTNLDYPLGDLWHTRWDMPVDNRKGEYITLNFDLNYVFEIEKLKYIPREDGGNGNFLRIRYRYSKNGQNWSSFYEAHFPRDHITKVLVLNNILFRYFQIDVLESVGGHGSAKRVIFYRNLNSIQLEK